jgi:hypothetical protein
MRNRFVTEMADAAPLDFPLQGSLVGPLWGLPNEEARAAFMPVWAGHKLMAWSKTVPVVPVKGDATQTYKILHGALSAGTLSFVWLDLDMDVLMEPVRQRIFSLLTDETIVGVDDYGRPETPTIKPWADKVEQAGQWKKLAEYPEHIAFYQKSRVVKLV